jgi:N-acyl-D-amino-acid deacylase
MSILTDYTIPPNGDPRLRNITLRQLLEHAGGWDRDQVGDPVDWSDRIAQALGVARPVTCPDMIRYMLGQPLQFTPGSRAAYSNFGYCILGQIVARVAGSSYERFVREQILAPLGVHAMSIGSRHPSERGTFEVKYYPFNGQLLRDSPFPGEGKVAAPYAIDTWMREASGGWVASAVDLTRLIAALDPALTPNFLSADSLAQMTADPGVRGTDAAYWYGLGLYVGPTIEWYGHGGDLPGTRTTVRREANGYTFAVLTNTRTSDDYLGELQQLVRDAIASGLTGSSTDLYPNYPSPALPASRP